MSFKEALKERKIENFIYFTDFRNFDSILANGILPENEVLRSGLGYYSFADKEVQKRRDSRLVDIPSVFTGNIHDFVPLYMSFFTPTLYVIKDQLDDLVFLLIDTAIADSPDSLVIFSDGNAGSSYSKLYTGEKNLDKLNWDLIKDRYWTIPQYLVKDHGDEISNYVTKRQKCSEFLINPYIPEEFIKKIIITSEKHRDEISNVRERHRISKWTMPASIIKRIF
jgi:hypothetical protein